MSEITRENALDPSAAPPLDESLLDLSHTEREFLHQAITQDDAELTQRILQVQKEYVSSSSSSGCFVSTVIPIGSCHCL